MLACCLAVGAQQKDSPPQPDTFTEAAASRLLDQVAEGLQSRITKKMLNAFDLARMAGGAVFRERVTAFMNQTDSIRVHFKLHEVADNVAVVDVEMEAVPHSDIAPPERKHMELRFTAAPGRDGWKFVDVQPRGFFSL